MWPELLSNGQLTTSSGVEILSPFSMSLSLLPHLCQPGKFRRKRAKAASRQLCTGRGFVDWRDFSWHSPSRTSVPRFLRSVVTLKKPLYMYIYIFLKVFTNRPFNHYSLDLGEGGDHSNRRGSGSDNLVYGEKHRGFHCYSRTPWSELPLQVTARFSSFRFEIWIDLKKSGTIAQMLFTSGVISFSEFSCELSPFLRISGGTLCWTVYFPSLLMHSCTLVLNPVDAGRLRWMTT